MTHLMRKAACLVVLLVGLPAGSVFADLITPGGLNPGDQFRVVFVTAGTTPATSTSFATYDAFVSGEATAAGLNTYQGNPVTWMAIGSLGRTAGLNAIDRLPADAVPIYLPDGAAYDLVATGGAALWNTSNVPLLHAVDHKPTGAPQSGTFVWTGTNASGAGVIDGTFLGSTINVTVGFTGTTGPGWMAASYGAGLDRHLYGFSSVLTVPNTSVVPEPASITLALVGLGGMAGARTWRRWRKSPEPPASCP